MMTKQKYKSMIREDILGYGLSQFHTEKGFWSIEIDPYNFSNPNTKTKYSVTLLKDHISKKVLKFYTEKTLDEVVDIILSED